ncbi:ABC transporter ATP-binding protein [Acholeplasma hippikon]|nr:ABC transporter ATP-binding protein [Acholeplasma hippikon]
MIEMRNITKKFGPLVANDNISFVAYPGKIHALLGENGAGKSTLMSILFGLYKQDEGDILINDEVVQINNPNDATKYKIGMVHQHFKLVEVFTVLDNIILGVEESKGVFLTKQKAREKITGLMDKYKLFVDLDSYVKDLTVGEQQKVEILKMLYRDSEILIFDEPTAVLTPQEIHEFMGIIKGFAKENKVVILITHKLNEIKEAAEECTILRRGKKIDTVNVKDVTVKQLAEMMVGRVIDQSYKKAPYQPGEEVLTVRNVNLQGKNKHLLTDVSFSVKSGEIVGVAGIDGNGQNELVQVLTGLMKPSSGEILINGTDVSRYSIRKRNEYLSHIPEDRQKHGLVLDYNLAYNLVLQTYFKEPFQHKGKLNHKEIVNYAEKLVEQYDIRSANGIKSSARSMSGGNQQKAIIARELEKQHDLVIAFQPTRGLDVGAIENIHKELIAERDKGKAILLVSFELQEIMSLSDVILVIFEGQIVGKFRRNEIDDNEIGLYMSGSKRGTNV